MEGSRRTQLMTLFFQMEEVSNKAERKRKTLEFEPSISSSSTVKNVAFQVTVVVSWRENEKEIWERGIRLPLYWKCSYTHTHRQTELHCTLLQASSSTPVSDWIRKKMFLAGKLTPTYSKDEEENFSFNPHTHFTIFSLPHPVNVVYL